MTRENQGLQIALIVSVMLTVVFGGMTYYWYRQYDDANTKANGYFSDMGKYDRQAKESAREVGDLKAMIGVAETDKVDAIKTSTFNDDMTKYGGGFPVAERDYRRVMDKQQKTIEEKNASLADEKARVQGLEQQIKIFEDSKQPQIDDYQKASDEARKDLTEERVKFNADRDRLTRDQTTLQGERDGARKDKDAETQKAEQKSTADGKRITDLTEKIESLAKENSQITSTKLDAFDGEIRWVDQRNGTVWINRGRADALQRQITFSVYPPDVTDLTVTGNIKASIEVTKVLGDHLAEARVLDDKVTDPIIPGDKIHTPLWAPGEKKHFALAGFMDIYGNDKNDVKLLIDLIKMNDGIVDAYIEDKSDDKSNDKSSNLVGAITVKTRYLVLGEAPTEKGLTSQIESYGKLVDSAKKLGIQTITLGDLLQRMGWKNATPLVRYGDAANPKDFAPKPEEGAPRKSAGNVSDTFKPRRPPGGTSSGTPSPTATPSGSPPSAYHRF